MYSTKYACSIIVCAIYMIPRRTSLVWGAAFGSDCPFSSTSRPGLNGPIRLRRGVTQREPRAVKNGPHSAGIQVPSQKVQDLILLELVFRAQCSGLSLTGSGSEPVGDTGKPWKHECKTQKFHDFHGSKMDRWMPLRSGRQESTPST